MRLSAILIAFLSVLFWSCGNDDVLEGDNVLHYDGDNATSPTLPPGVYTAAIRFPENLLRNVEGRTIDAVSVYFYDVPETARLVLAYDRSPQEPTDAIYEENITDQLQSNSWNTITLDQSYGITGAPLWIGIEMNLLAPVQSIGCDAGPNKANGDWLYDAADQLWLSFQERVGDNINWNIRAVLSL